MVEPTSDLPFKTDFMLDLSPEEEPKEFDDDDTDYIDSEDEDTSDEDDDPDTMYSELVEDIGEELENLDVDDGIDNLLGYEDDDYSGFVTIPQLNYSIPWKGIEEDEDEDLDKFTPESSGELHPSSAQVCKVPLICQHYDEKSVYYFKKFSLSRYIVQKEIFFVAFKHLSHCAFLLLFHRGIGLVTGRNKDPEEKEYYDAIR